jgi:hypothetical protein
LYLVPYLIVFFGLQQYSYLHSNRLMSFWKESKSASICKGCRTYTCCVYNRNNISYHNIYLVYW